MKKFDTLIHEIGSSVCVSRHQMIYPYGEDYIFIERDGNHPLFGIYESLVLRMLDTSEEFQNIINSHLNLIPIFSNTDLNTYDIILTDEEKLEFTMEYFS